MSSMRALRRRPHARIRAELHTHSTASDGAHPPRELAQLAAKLGVRVLSLTDHDTCRGCAEAASACAELGVEFIPGVEVSAYLEGRSIHVLGYGLDPQDPQLEAFLEHRRRLREDRMGLMVERAQALGLEVTFEEVEAQARGASLTRPHLAHALVARGYARDLPEAFERYLAQGRPVYLASSPLSVPEAIAFIRAARGVSVLAHPGIEQPDALWEAWVEAGLDGVEVEHPSHSRAQQARYERLARRYGLLATRSSDFHGLSVRPKRRLGERWMETHALERLRALMAARRGS